MVDASAQLFTILQLSLGPSSLRLLEVFCPFPDCFLTNFFLIMSTVLSTLGYCSDKVGSDHRQQFQRGNHIYSEIFHENLPVSSDRECDFDLFNVIVNAVRAVKNRSKCTFISSDNKVKLNIKFPCVFCHKSVNKNQKSNFLYNLPEMDPQKM